jgi:radical S-adenosyl methionine domain-containing protein 2
MMEQTMLRDILRQIADLPLPAGCAQRKVTFAGGEPLLYQTIWEDIAFAHELGLCTALVTNGYNLTPEKMQKFSGILDWLALSVDSLNPETNYIIGRRHGRNVISTEDYMSLAEMAKYSGIRLKINTVISAANVHEDFVPFIQRAQPIRWKILQCTQIKGENSRNFANWEVSELKFRDFLKRHEKLSAVSLVPETQEEIYSSYAMIAPNGTFFDNSTSEYRYSQPITKIGIKCAFSETRFSLDCFNQRNGSYDFQTGENINLASNPDPS